MKRWIPFISHNGPKEINGGKRSFYEEAPSDPIVYLFKDKIREDEVNKINYFLIEETKRERERERERERRKITPNTKEDLIIFVENVKCLCKNINDSLGKVIFEVESAKNLYSLCNVVVYNGKMECGFKLKIELSEDLSQKFIYVIFYYKKFRKLDSRLGKWATLIKNRYYRSRSNIKTVKEIYVNPDRITDRDLEEWLKWIYHGFKRSYTPGAIKSRKR